MRPSPKATSKAFLRAALGTITLKDEKGTPIEHAYCDVWRFREGKMAELQAFVVETSVESGTPAIAAGSPELSSPNG